MIPTLQGWIAALTRSLDKLYMHVVDDIKEGFTSPEKGFEMLVKYGFGLTGLALVLTIDFRHILLAVLAMFLILTSYRMFRRKPNPFVRKIKDGKVVTLKDELGDLWEED